MFKNSECIDGYTIHYDKIVGQGAFAICYDCAHSEIKIPMCVKIINLTTSQNELIEREVSILNTLKNKQNSNIVKIYHITRQNKKCFIFMEKCIQGSFKQYATKMNRQGQQYSLSQIVNILKDIINGYYILHTNSIIHRDLKPENLLIGNDGNVKIADYGLGKIISDLDSLQHHTMVGTPLYAAPQILSNCNYSAKCDVYSLGVIIYETIFKKLPFEANSILALKKNQEKLKNTPISIPPILLQGDDKDRIKLEYFLKNSIVYSEEFRLSWDTLFTEYLNINQSIEKKFAKTNEARNRAKSTNQQIQSNQEQKKSVHEPPPPNKQPNKVYPMQDLIESFIQNQPQKPKEISTNPTPPQIERVPSKPQNIKILEVNDITKPKNEKQNEIKKEQQIEHPNQQVLQQQIPIQQQEQPSKKEVQKPIIIEQEQPRKVQQLRPQSSKQPTSHELISDNQVKQKIQISPKKNFGLLKKKLEKQPHSYLVYQLIEVILAKFELVKGYLTLFEKYQKKNSLHIPNIDFSIMKLYLLGYQYSILLNVHDLIFNPNVFSGLNLLKQVLDQKSINLETQLYIQSEDQKTIEQQQKFIKIIIDHSKFMKSFKDNLMAQLSKLQENHDTQTLRNLLQKDHIYYNYLSFIHEFKNKFSSWKKSYSIKQQKFDFETLQIVAYAIKICQLEKEYLMQDFEKIEPSTILYMNREEKVLEQYVNNNKVF